MRNRSATRPEICHANNPAKQTIPHRNYQNHQFSPMESGYTNKSGGIPRCQTTSSITPTRNLTKNPLEKAGTHQNPSNKIQNTSYNTSSQNIPSKLQFSNQNNHPTPHNHNSQQVPDNIPHYKSSNNSTANITQSSGKSSTFKENNKENLQHNTSTPGSSNKAQLHNLTRNHFIAASGTPPAEPQINVIEASRSNTITNSSNQWRK